MNDAELLRAYAGSGSEEAFRSLVDRYVRLVYGACWRQLGDRHLAEDATQGVFVLLSQRAGQLRQGRMAGWLLTAARYACANIRKVQQRRERREQVVAMLRERGAGGGNEELLAVLDEGLGKLGAADREALVLRYLQEQPLRDVGQALGVSEEAARKRVDRGLEKLRRYFVRRGVATSSAALAAVLGEEARGTGLTATTQETMTQGIVQTCQAGAGGAGAAIEVAKGIEAMMAMAKLKVAGMVLAVLAASVGGSWVVMTQAGAKGAGQKTAAPATQTVAAVPATAPATQAVVEVVVDLSTPEKALGSLCRAMRAGDRAKTFQCLGVDPNRPARPNDGSIAVALAQNRLIRAAAQAFGGSGEEARDVITHDLAFEILLDMMRMQGQTVSVEGDSAFLVIEVPRLAMRLMPAGLEERAHQWAGKLVRFRKQAGGWALDLDRLVRPTIILLGGPGQKNRPIEDEAAQAAFLMEYAQAIDQTAADLERGLMATWDDANKILRARQRRTLDKYPGFTWVVFDAMPVEEMGEKP